MPSFVSVGLLVASAILSVLLGFVWYGPLFGKPWMKYSGIHMPSKKPGFGTMLKPILLSFVGAVLLSFTLSSVIAFHNFYYETGGVGAALAVALFLWLGFIVPIYLNFAGWEGKPGKLFFINSGYWLVFLAIVAYLSTVIK